MKNKAKKAASKAMREKAEEALTELQNYPNGMFRLVKGLKTDSKEVEGGRCVRGSDGGCMRGSDGGCMRGSDGGCMRGSDGGCMRGSDGGV